MLRNLFPFVPFLLLVNVSVAVALPDCQGSYDPNTWINCKGTHSYSDEDRYVGEWRSKTFRPGILATTKMLFA